MMKSDQAYCHGLLVRWGETNNHVPRRGLYLRCEMSSRILSGILKGELSQTTTTTMYRCKRRGKDQEEDRNQLATVSP
jgi:hypothetical protein